MNYGENITCHGSRETLLRFLLIKAAPVMMKARPAALIRLTNCGRMKELQRYDQFCMYQQEIIATLKVDYLVLKNDGRNVQVLFYDRKMIAELLEQPEINDYLKQCGYHDIQSRGQCMSQLKQRFCSSKFPHEIGVFLGYPLKDVRGFIEKRTEALPLPRVSWQVYEDPAESLRRMWMHRLAEETGREALALYQDLELCVEHIRGAAHGLYDRHQAAC